MQANINASPETVRSCAESVKAFSNTIRNDCKDLAVALKKFAPSMEEEEVAFFRDTVNKILECLEEEDPNMQELAKKLEAYAAGIDRLRQIARG